MTHFANIHKYSSNWKLSTPYSHSGNCWVMEVDWDVRHRLLQPSILLEPSPSGLVNPSYLISLHSLPLLLLCRELSFKGFDEEMEVSYFTGTVALCVLGQLLSDLPVSSLQGTSTLNCLSSCVGNIMSLSWIENYIITSWAGLMPSYTSHCGWDLETDKKRKEFIKSGHFIFLQKGTKAKRPMRGKK